MRRFFVSSDIHGFFDEWQASLQEAGFEKENPDHVLIVLGDIFDRGEKPREVLSFLKSLPPERRILVWGNHEDLFLELAFRRAPYDYDISNGTYGTVKSFFDGNYDEMIENFRKENPYPINDPEAYPAWRAKNTSFFNATEEMLYNGPGVNEAIEFLTSKDWVYYYETEHYIFVHSFIPLIEVDGEEQYEPRWRNANHKKWKEATWGCPWMKYKNGLFEPEEKNGKTLVVGHWHTSDFYNNLDYLNEPEKKLTIRENPIYRSPKFPGLIGLDACTALTHKVNVLVLNEDEL